MDTQDDFQFDGFEPANTTPVPDIFFDLLLSKLSGAEVKVLLYIIRRTWGFKKQTDAISLSQLQNGIKTREGKVLDRGCGIKRRETICEALASLEKKKCIFSQKGKTSYNDNNTTVYGIYFKQQVVSKPDYPQTAGSFKTGLPVVSKPDQGSPVTGPGVVSKPDPQETVIQQTEFQETVIQKDMSNNISVIRADETSDESKNTVSDGGNGSSSIQDIPSQKNANLQPLSEQIEAALQKVEGKPPVQNKMPENEAQAQTRTLPPSKEETLPASYSPRQATNKRPAPPIPITTGTRNKKDATQLLTLQGSHVIELYEAFKKRKITRNSANVKAANGLGDVVESDQDFNEVLTLIANDKFLKEHNVRIDLDFVYRKYDGFLDKVDRLREEAERRSSGKPSQGNTNSPAKQEPTPEKAASIAAAEAVMARLKQRQAI